MAVVDEGRFSAAGRWLIERLRSGSGDPEGRRCLNSRPPRCEA